MRAQVTNDLLDTKNSRERRHWDWNHGLLVSEEVGKKAQVPLSGSVLGRHLCWGGTVCHDLFIRSSSGLLLHN